MHEETNRLMGEMEEPVDMVEGPGRRNAASPGPGSLGSPAHAAGTDFWNMPADAFEALTRRAIAGELLNMKGDL